MKYLHARCLLYSSSSSFHPSSYFTSAYLPVHILNGAFELAGDLGPDFGFMSVLGKWFGKGEKAARDAGSR